MDFCTRFCNKNNILYVTVGLKNSEAKLVKHIFLVKFDFIIQYGDTTIIAVTIFRSHFYRTISL
jgi:hypothetical protein